MAYSFLKSGSLELLLKGVDNAPLLLAGHAATSVAARLEAPAEPSRQADVLALNLDAGLVSTLHKAESAGAANAVAGDMLAALLGQGASADVRVAARITAPVGAGPATTGRAAIEKISVQAGPLRVAGHASWQSGVVASWFGGPLDVDIQTNLGLQAEANTDAPVPASAPAPAPESGPATGPVTTKNDAGESLLPARAQLRVALSGPLEAPDSRISALLPAFFFAGAAIFPAPAQIWPAFGGKQHEQCRKSDCADGRGSARRHLRCP